ncbi:hypothetical protein DsansV1_C10g0102781 [Dioscorea sansibarensis]
MFDYSISFHTTSLNLFSNVKCIEMVLSITFNFILVADSKQQMDLIHKVPQKNSRLKLTIPREPELETAQRAQRILEAPSLPLHQKSKPQLPEFQAGG